MKKIFFTIILCLFAADAWTTQGDPVLEGVSSNATIPAGMEYNATVGEIVRLGVNSTLHLPSGAKPGESVEVVGSFSASQSWSVNASVIRPPSGENIGNGTETELVLDYDRSVKVTKGDYSLWSVQ